MGKHVLKWISHVMLMAFLMMLVGCGGDTTVNQTTASASGIVSGRVIDSSTLQPVKNADVELIANGVKTTTRSSASDDPDLAGTFVFSGVSATVNYSPGHTLKISAPSYATMQLFITVAGSNDNSPVTTSLGNVALGKGFDLTVIATDNGTAVSGITVNASTYWSYAPGITAVTDANGQAVLKGLNQELTYQITSAPFYDGTGTLKYVASSANSTGYSSLSGQVVSLPLVSATRHDNIQIVASNLIEDGTMSYSYPPVPVQRVITPGSVIKIVFNYPVTLVSGVTATYVNNLVSSSDPAYGTVVSVPTVSASLDSTGTILTITNSAPYLKNQTYTFNGTVMAEVNSQMQYFSLGNVPSNPFFASNVYVADNSASGLSSLTTLKADNFNGTTGVTATTFPVQVYVEFPEKVYGTYSVVAQTSGGTTTVINGAPVSFGFADGTIVYAANVGGADNAVVFRVPILALYLADNSVSSVNEATISFNVTDAEGNNFSRTVTLPVQ